MIKNTKWQFYFSKIDLRKRCFLTKLTAKSHLYLIKYMEEDISPTVMFRGTPCRKLEKKINKKDMKKDVKMED